MSKQGALRTHDTAVTRNSGQWQRFNQEKLLGEMLQQWHSSGGDPIYAVGSHLYAGHHPHINACFNALRNLERTIPDNETDAQHLQTTKLLLIDYIQQRTWLAVP